MFMSVWKRIIIFFYISLISASGYTQKFTLETLIDTNRIVLGDQIDLTYAIRKEDNISIDFPTFTKELTEGIEILHEPVIDSSKMKDGKWMITLDLVITSFDTGIYYIPQQKFIVSENQFYDTILSTATYLEVYGVAIDTTNTIRDIKPPAKVPITFSEILFYCVAVLLLAAIIFFLIRYFRKRNKKESFFISAKPEEPPHITAFRELDKIKAQKLWQKKKVKEYYTRITFIIRWYIFKRFNIHALEETTEEILYFIKSLGLDDINSKNLESLLNLADIVKFAKGEPNPEENIIHLDNAYDFIRKTKQEEYVETGKKRS